MTLPLDSDPDLKPLPNEPLKPQPPEAQPPDVNKIQKGKLLPGVAGIAMFLLFLTLANVYGALTNLYGTGRNKYAILALCTFLVLGVFGLLRMTRWGWALVTAACLLLACSYAWIFRLTHDPRNLIQGAFGLVFFLYLVRPEVRERTR